MTRTEHQQKVIDIISDINWNLPDTLVRGHEKRYPEEAVAALNEYYYRQMAMKFNEMLKITKLHIGIYYDNFDKWETIELGLFDKDGDGVDISCVIQGDETDNVILDNERQEHIADFLAPDLVDGGNG